MKVQSFWELEPSNGSGSQSLGLELLFVLKTFPIASANTVASASCKLETGVSSSVGSRCADPRCVDMLAGVGGYIDCRVMGLNFLSCHHLLCQPTSCGSKYFYNQCPQVPNLIGTEHSLNRSEHRVQNEASLRVI